MTRLECVWWRAPISHIHIRIFVSRFLALSLSVVLSTSRVTTDFYAIRDKKKCVFLHESPSRKIGLSSIGTERARVLISLLRAPHVSPIGSSLVITVTASTLLLRDIYHSSLSFSRRVFVKHAIRTITTTIRSSRIVKRQLINEARALPRAYFFRERFSACAANRPTERARGLRFPPLHSLSLSFLLSSRSFRSFWESMHPIDRNVRRKISLRLAPRVISTLRRVLADIFLLVTRCSDRW